MCECSRNRPTLLEKNILAKSAKNLSQSVSTLMARWRLCSVHFRKYGLVVMAAHPPRMCCDNAWGFFDIYSVHSVHLLERMDCFHIFLPDQPQIFSFTHLHCKFPSHHPYVSLDRPRCRLIPFRDDRPRYLVESQICQERRISPGHETVAILS